MKVFSIDLETTGLNPKSDQVLQIGVVYFNTLLPFEQREKLSYVIKWDRIQGHPRALAMNAGLISYIDKAPGACHYFPEAMKLLTSYIKTKFDSDIERVKFTAAGKNFASFDNLFLPWQDDCKPHHRTLDPGSMFARTLDEAPPTLSECCERAGVLYDPNQAHNAVYDADIVAECVYNFFKGHPRL